MSRNRKVHRDIHHRKPRSLFAPGDRSVNDPRNLSSVPRHKHEAWHLLFANYEPWIIVQIINESWLDSDFYMVAMPKHKKKAHKYLRTSHITCDNCGSKCTIKHVKKEVTKKL